MIFLLVQLICYTIFLFHFVECQSQLLDCNFDQQNFCQWSNGFNGVEDDFDWRINNSAPIDGFHSIPRTVTGTGFFAYAQGQFRATESEAAKAWLLSPVIGGLSAPATMTFVFWKTAAPPVLQTCIRDSTNPITPRCLDTISGLGQANWVQRTVTIPSNQSPFQIILIASSFRTGLDLVGVDDVTVKYSTSETLGRVQPGSPAALTAYAPPGGPPYPPGGQPNYPQPFPGPLAPSPGGPGVYAQPAPGVPVGIPGVPGLPGGIYPGAQGPISPPPQPPPPGPGVYSQIQPQPIGIPPQPIGVPLQPIGIPPQPLQPIGIQPPTPGVSPQQILPPRQLPQPNYLIPGPPPPPAPIIEPPIGVPRTQEPYIFITQPSPINPQPPFTQPPFINTQPPPFLTQPPYANIQPPFVNTQPPFINTQPPFINIINTQPPFITNPPPYINIQPPFVNTQPPFINTQPPFVNLISTQPPFVNTAASPPPVYINAGPQVSLPNPRPLFPNSPFPQQVDRNTFQPIPPNPIDRNPPPPPIVQTVPSVTQIERIQAATGPNPVVINPPPLNPQYYVPGGNNNPTGQPIGEERSTGNSHYESTPPAGEATTHDHRFYMTTVKEEEQRTASGHQTSPRLAVRVDQAEASNGQCAAVACPFNKDFCKWYNDLSSNFDWKLKYAPVPYQGAGYIFVNGDYRKFDQRASIKTPSFVVPGESVLEFLAFVSDSDSGRLSVYMDDSSNPSNLLWKAIGHKNLGGTGWRRIRVPLPISSFPTTLALVADQLTLGQFIGLDDVRLTDKSGFDIGCASDSAFPESTATPRVLPNLQQLTPLVPDGNVAKINEAPIRESAAFATPKFSTSRGGPVGRKQAISNDQNFQLNDQVDVLRYNSPGLSSIINVENPLKKDQIIDNAPESVVRDTNDLIPLNLTTTKKKYAKSVNNTEEFKFPREHPSDENPKRKKNSNQTFSGLKTTSIPDPLGLKDFVLQISRDLRDLISQTPGRLNLNNYYSNLYSNYPIF